MQLGEQLRQLGIPIPGGGLQLQQPLPPGVLPGALPPGLLPAGFLPGMSGAATPPLAAPAASGAQAGNDVWKPPGQQKPGHKGEKGPAIDVSTY